MLASRNKKRGKTRWAVTRRYAGKRRGRARGKGRGHYPRLAGGRDDTRRKMNEEETAKEDGDKLDDAKEEKWNDIKQEGASGKGKRGQTEVERLRQIKRVRTEDRKTDNMMKRRRRGKRGGGGRERVFQSRYFTMKPCNFRRNVQWQWSRVYITSTPNHGPPSTSIRRQRRS